MKSGESRSQLEGEEPGWWETQGDDVPGDLEGGERRDEERPQDRKTRGRGKHRRDKEG